MSDDSLTLQVLVDIRSEIRGMHAEIRATNARLDMTNARLEQGFAEVRAELRTEIGELRNEFRTGIGAVRREAAEAELRAATRHVEFVASTRDLNDRIVTQFVLQHRVEQCETDIATIKRKLDD